MMPSLPSLWECLRVSSFGFSFIRLVWFCYAVIPSNFCHGWYCEKLVALYKLNLYFILLSDSQSLMRHIMCLCVCQCRLYGVCIVYRCECISEVPFVWFILFIFFRVLCKALCSMSGCFSRVELYKSRNAKADDDKIQQMQKAQKIFVQEEMCSSSNKHTQHTHPHSKLQCA